MNSLKYISRILRSASESVSFVYKCRDYTQNNFIRRMLKLIALPYGLMKYFHTGKSNLKREGLAFVLSAKNEAQYIEEWINFHAKQGVSHFLIYNDSSSTDNLHDVLKEYIDAGLVTYHVIGGGLARQEDIYNMAVAKYKKRFKYMGFIDADEFVFLRKTSAGENGNLCKFLDDFMSEYPNAGGIGVNWLIFGSSGHEKKPEGGVLKNFVMCAEKDFGPNHLIKTICDPMKVLGICNPHFAVYRRGFYNLNENGEVIENSFAQNVSFEKIRINHYYSKSKEEFILRRANGRFEGAMEGFYHHDQNVLKDTEILERI